MLDEVSGSKPIRLFPSEARRLFLFLWFCLWPGFDSGQSLSLSHTDARTHDLTWVTCPSQLDLSHLHSHFDLSCKKQVLCNNNKNLPFTPLPSLFLLEPINSHPTIPVAAIPLNAIFCIGHHLWKTSFFFTEAAKKCSKHVHLHTRLQRVVSTQKSEQELKAIWFHNSFSSCESGPSQWRLWLESKRVVKNQHFCYSCQVVTSSHSWLDSGLTKFPWLSMLEEKQRDKIKLFNVCLLCIAGTIINSGTWKYFGVKGCACNLSFCIKLFRMNSKFWSKVSISTEMLRYNNF